MVNFTRKGLNELHENINVARILNILNILPDFGDVSKSNLKKTSEIALMTTLVPRF